jgi:hypothetical protein
MPSPKDEWSIANATSQVTDCRAVTRFQFRPISLIHLFAKSNSEVLAMRLAPHINELVSQVQSAIIRCRCIHDNFLYVRNLARAYNRKKTPTLLMKLVILKAFDSVLWEY